MNNLKANIQLKNVYLEDYHDLLEIINKIDDNVQVQFEMPITNIIVMVKEYLKLNTDHLTNLDEYDCICPEITDKYGDGTYFFNLNSSDDDDDHSDVEFIQKEFKRLFGVNFNSDVEVSQLLNVLLMGSCYAIIDNALVVDMYYKTYSTNWLKEVLPLISY